MQTSDAAAKSSAATPCASQKTSMTSQPAKKRRQEEQVPIFSVCFDCYMHAARAFREQALIVSLNSTLNSSCGCRGQSYEVWCGCQVDSPEGSESSSNSEGDAPQRKRQLTASPAPSKTRCATKLCALLMIGLFLSFVSTVCQLPTNCFPVLCGSLEWPREERKVLTGPSAL